MAWCPNCKSEFVAGVSECPVCHEALVEELPVDEMEYIPDTWKMVAEYTDDVSGSLAEGLLQDNGIACRLENITIHAAPVMVSQDLTGTRVWVEAENVDDARKLLEEVENYCLCSECESLVSKDDKECPECGASLED